MGRKPQVEAMVEIEDTMVVNAIHLGDDRIARIKAFELAGCLGFRNRRFIKKLIMRNRAEIERHGQLLSDPSGEFWLTINQGMTVCQLSRTKHAPVAREALTRAFAQLTAPPPAEPSQALVPMDNQMGMVVAAAGEVARQIVTPILEEMRRGNQDLIQHIGRNDRRVANVEEVVSHVNTKLTAMEQRELKKRRNITPEVEAQHVQITEADYGGRCPCCRETATCAAGQRIPGATHVDHWYGKHKRSLRETWIICAACNLALSASRQFKDQHNAEFLAYQHRVNVFLKVEQETLPLFG